MNRIKKHLCNPIVALCVLYGAGTAHADAVTDWNAIMEATVAAPPTNPFFQALGAIVQLAVFEAVNAVVGDYEPYLGTITAPPGASPDAAAIAAAYRTLVTLRRAAPRPSARAGPIAGGDPGRTGEGCRHRSRRGRGGRYAPAPGQRWIGTGRSVPYTPGTEPGDWQPTPPLFAPALLPGWGLVTPFGLEEGSQFRAPPPPALHSGKYANDYNEVKLVGRIDSPFRPQDRTDVARFYAAATPIQVFNPAAPGQRRAGQDALGERADLRPAWRWPWPTARSRCSTPSTSTIAGGPLQRSGTQTSTTIATPTRIRPGSR